MSHSSRISPFLLRAIGGRTLPYNDDNDTVCQDPLWIELTYLGPIHLAMMTSTVTVLTVLWNTFTHCQDKDRQVLFRLLQAVAVMVMGLILIVLAALAVDAFCQYFPPTGGIADALSAPTLVFAGCNVAFVGWHLWLRRIEEDAFPLLETSGKTTIGVDNKYRPSTKTKLS